MQRQRIVKTMWSFRCRWHTFDFKLEPVATFQMVDTAGEGEKEGERIGIVIGNPMLSGYDIKWSQASQMA